jgi:hypothetical protein
MDASQLLQAACFLDELPLELLQPGGELHAVAAAWLLPHLPIPMGGQAQVDGRGSGAEAAAAAAQTLARLLRSNVDEMLMRGEGRMGGNDAPLEIQASGLARALCVAGSAIEGYKQAGAAVGPPTAFNCRREADAFISSALADLSDAVRALPDCDWMAGWQRHANTVTMLNALLEVSVSDHRSGCVSEPLSAYVA